MIMHKPGCIEKGVLIIKGIKRWCPYSSGAYCGTDCALFDAVEDFKTGKAVGAYLGCCGQQWTFDSETK